MAFTCILTSLITLLCLCMFCVNAATNKEFLQMGQQLSTSDTVLSYDGNFELGFFSRVIENSTKYYVGIWSKKVPNDKIVWVASRENAVEASSAVLTIDPNGNLVIIDEQVTYRVHKASNNFSTYAMLLDSRNLVLLNTSNQAILWQSFDNPTDTLLAEMNIGNDYEFLDWSLLSNLRPWKSEDDPAPGVLELEPSYSVIDMIDKFLALKVAESNSRLVLKVSGELNLEYWSNESKHWVSVLSHLCDTQVFCGDFGICKPQSLDPCDCLTGFKPSDADSWRKGNNSAGCVRKKELSCSDGVESNDGFLLFTNVTLPLLSKGYDRIHIDSARACENTCSRNCSCVAYAYDINSMCTMWFFWLSGLQTISANVNSTTQYFYLKLAASELISDGLNTMNKENPTNDFHRHENRRRNILLTVILISCLTSLILGLFGYWTRSQRVKGEDLLHFDVGMSMKVKNSELTNTEANTGVKVKKEVKLPLFSFVSVAAATNNFSKSNKLGEGGFGPVYKGKLLNGDEVAVKRLSRRSGQGWEELRNEALLIAKLQHNNLVRILGCCIDQDEKMLIYEFMPNKSLDVFLFDETKRMMLDWGTRVRIIDGISQGILYLHQYSRFRIIHRDLKASNILLDINMNPKISDFGLARMFGENELQANTNRIVGTYGYMSPEYATEGLFSIKSDVFSFGVLLLEIVSGKKNTGFYQTNSFNLLGYAWDLWTSNSAINLMDPTLNDSDSDSSSKHKVARYVNIGLLCVQDGPADRPIMSDVVSMIGNDSISLPSPKPPAFLNVRGNQTSKLPASMPQSFSVNLITDSVVEAR